MSSWWPFFYPVLSRSEMDSRLLFIALFDVFTPFGPLGIATETTIPSVLSTVFDQRESPSERQAHAAPVQCYPFHLYSDIDVLSFPNHSMTDPVVVA